MKLQVSLLTCGSCGKPRGRYHACTGRRGKRDRLKPGLRLTCSRCGREMLNPLAHTCAPKSDFKKRKAAQKRRLQAEERRRRRKAAADRKRARAKEAAARRREAAKKRKAEAAAKPRRKRTAAHVPRLCKDPDCQRYGCLKYREGWDDGYRWGYAVGYGTGYADGFAEGYAAGSGE